MTESAYDIALKAAQHQALDRAVADGRITPAQKDISADLLDGKITEEEAQQRYDALHTADAGEPQ